MCPKDTDAPAWKIICKLQTSDVVEMDGRMYGGNTIIMLFPPFFERRGHKKYGIQCSKF